MPEGSLPPRVAVMQMVHGAWVCQTLSAITRLGVPDHLDAKGALTARQLVEDCGVEAIPDFLERALRAAASIGVLTEDAAGRFGPTPLSSVLCAGSPESVKSFVELFGGDWWALWGGLTDALRTGGSQSVARLGREPWDQTPEEMERFGLAMQSRREPAKGLLEHCDLSAYSVLVDVGGGFGHLSMAVLERYPKLRAVVLDLPELIPIAQRHAVDKPGDVLERLAFVGGDMFAAVPAGDAFVLSGILHDWDDERARQILARCAEQMNGDSRLFCIDTVLPPLGDTGESNAKFLDLNMMVGLPGKERTEAQWQAVFASAGLRVERVTRLAPINATSVIEGSLA